MTIEGLGKKFQEARLARKLTLEEAARITKIRPTRLAEIEADDFSQFPSLAYAKGFLLIYGKFLDVDVTPYLDAFEGSSNITVNGYSYLQESPAPTPPRAPNVRVSPRPISFWPVVIAVGILVIGFFAIKLIVNLNRLAPRKETMIGVPEAAIPTTPTAQTRSPVVKTSPPTMTVARALPIAPAPKTAEPEVRKARPVGPEDLAGAASPGNSPSPAEQGETRVDIKPLKKTYIKVTVDNAAKTPEYERWISPSDGTVEFRGQHIAVRVLDREAIQIRKNGKPLSEGDSEVTIQ
ncbi:MAG: helix-turn-helix domain-containing protein [Chthoniobacterales bacterium]